MRSLKIAIWTSGDPVSEPWTRCSLIKFALSSLSTAKPSAIIRAREAETREGPVAGHGASRPDRLEQLRLRPGEVHRSIGAARASTGLPEQLARVAFRIEDVEADRGPVVEREQ